MTPEQWKESIMVAPQRVSLSSSLATITKKLHTSSERPCWVSRGDCHAQIQRTQKAKEIFATTAASNAATATAIAAASVISTPTYATPPKAIANAATSRRPQTTMGKIG
jgi:hypothetical protein